MILHPQFEALRGLVSSTATKAWSGVAYRVTSLAYPGPRAILSGEGSFLHGGRFNAPRSFHGVYGSTDDLVAVRESRATADYFNVGYPFVKPRLLVAIEFALQKVIDWETIAFSSEIRDELRTEDWRQCNARGQESLSQAVGRAVFACQMEALLAPSARVPKGVNVVYFPARRQKGSNAMVCEPEELMRLERA